MCKRLKLTVKKHPARKKLKGSPRGLSLPDLLRELIESPYGHLALMEALRRKPELIVLALQMPALRAKVRDYLAQIDPSSTSGGRPSTRARELRALVKAMYRDTERVPGLDWRQRCALVASRMQDPFIVGAFGHVDADEVRRIVKYTPKSER